MKQITTYCFFIFLLMCTCASAQIAYKITTWNLSCNHTSLGKIDIKPIPTNPPYTYLWNDGQTTSSINDLEPALYTVTITDTVAKKDSIVIVGIYENECEMSPESFFTPNGDGYNDTWAIGNYQYFPNALVLVYNRWGQKVFEHNGLYQLRWDGRDQLGVAVPDASYYYIVFKDRKKENELVKGSVSIIR